MYKTQTNKKLLLVFMPALLFAMVICCVVFASATEPAEETQSATNSTLGIEQTFTDGAAAVVDAPESSDATNPEDTTTEIKEPVVDPNESSKESSENAAVNAFAISEVNLIGTDKSIVRAQDANSGNFITDAFKWKADSIPLGNIPSENTVAVMNGGGIRADIKAGEFTENDVLAMLPFGNTLGVIAVKGSALLEVLEASTQDAPGQLGVFPQVAGIDFTINIAKAYDKQDETYPGSTYYGPKSIQRVTINSINGKEFDPNATYKVATNDFIIAGGDTYYAFSQSTEKVVTEQTIDKVVVDYIVGPLNRVIDKRYETAQGRIHIVENEYQVNFMDGDNVYTSKKVGEGLKVLKPADPTKKGSEFDGWYQDKECTNAWDFDTPVNSDLTLYAKWNSAPVPSEINADNAEATAQTDDMTYVVGFGLMLCALAAAALTIRKRREF